MRGRLLLRTTVSALLAASGLLMMWAAWVRWWPTCGFGDFDTPACLYEQSDPYLFRFSGGDWTPYAHATQLAGVSVLLLPVAIALLPFVLAGPRPGTVPLVVGGVMALSVLIVAGSLWLSAQAGRDVQWPGVYLAYMIYAFGGVVILLCLPLLPPATDWGPGPPWRLVVIACLFASTPLATYFLAMMFYASHDTTPWTEAVGGAFLVAAALAVWPASRGTARLRQPAPGPTTGSEAVATSAGTP